MSCDVAPVCALFHVPGGWVNGMGGVSESRALICSTMSTADVPNVLIC